MQTWEQIALIIGGLLIAWWGFITVKRNPSAFTKENFGKSLSTLGVLALILIALIALCIWILRTT